MEKRGSLQKRRRSGRGGARSVYRGRKNGNENFKAVEEWNDGQVQGPGGDGRTSRRAKLAWMRTARAGMEIGARVKLARQKDECEQQGGKPHSIGVGEHLDDTTKLRLEWLQGQAMRAVKGCTFCNPDSGRGV